MNSGRLRESIIFQSKTNVTDAGGGFTSTWAKTLNDRARIKPIVSEEAIKQEQIQQQNKYEITVRYRSAINRNMRIIWGAKTLTIISDPVNYDEKQKWLKMIATQE